MFFEFISLKPAFLTQHHIMRTPVSQGAATEADQKRHVKGLT